MTMTIDEINNIDGAKYEPELRAQLSKSFWDGLATLYFLRHDIPDGAWDDVKDLIPRNSEGKISRKVTDEYTSRQFSEIMSEIEEILEGWGLLAPW